MYPNASNYISKIAQGQCTVYSCQQNVVYGTNQSEFCPTHLQVTAVHAIEIMLGSADALVKMAALELVQDVIREPNNALMAQGLDLAESNRALIQGSKIPVALTHLIDADDRASGPIFSIATAALESIAVLLTSMLPTLLFTLATFDQFGHKLECNVSYFNFANVNGLMDNVTYGYTFV